MSVFTPLNLTPIDSDLPANIPPSDSDNYEIIQAGDQGARALVFSDPHIPYHSPIALQAAILYGMERKCNTVVINGDFIDFAAISQWNKDPRIRSISGELQIGKQVLKWIRKNFPNARILYKMG